MRKKQLTAYIVPLLTWVVACADSDTSPDYAIVDSAGVDIVTSYRPSWVEGARRVDAEPLLRIGDEAPGPYQFGLVDRALFLDSLIAVVDHQSNEIRLFDRVGEHVRTIGGPGEGPGEFGSITALFEYPGDSLVVFDQRLRRATILPKGPGSARVLPAETGQNVQLLGTTDDGVLLLYNPGQFRPELSEGPQWEMTDVIALAPDGAARVILQAPVLQRLIGPGGLRRSIIPLGVSIQAAWRRGFYWGTSDRYEVVYRDLSGNAQMVLRRTVEPRPVTDAMITEYMDGMLEWVRRTQGESAIPRYREHVEEGRFAEYVPFFSTAFVDRDGRLWIGESGWPRFEGLPKWWSVFDTTGVWLGDIEAPPNLMILDGMGDTILGVWRDSLDVQHVQLHQVVAND